MFVAIEGTDGAGKATQAKMLAERIDRTGNFATVLSFPRYETELGRAILRHLKGETTLAEAVGMSGEYKTAPEDPLVFQCMMLADKYDAAPEIRDALRRGRTVICDRWIPSCIAFGGADGLPIAWLSRVHEQLPQPDLNVFIDVPEDEALRRRPQMRDRYERDREKQKVVRANYKQLWEARSTQPANGRWVTVNGLGTVDEVHARIWAEIVALAPRM